MRNFIWSLVLFSSLTTVSYSQIKNLEKGTYLSVNKGQKIKLNLLDDSKYELVFYTGSYEIKGDSLVFINNPTSENNFNLSYKNDKKAKNIKIKFLDPSYYSFYIGTQKGNEEIKYQKLSDIRTKQDPNWEKTDLEFEIDKTDFIYLVYEDYYNPATVAKYAVPKEVSEITINYELGAVTDLKLAGFFDKSKSELQISEPSGKNPLVFVNEKDPQPVKKEGVTAIETKSVTNWTYPGKEPAYTDYDASLVATDTLAVIDDAIAPPAASNYDFKLKIENSLSNAIKATKESSTNKYLVVYNDSKKTAKTSFDAFVKDQETQTGYNMYDAYNPQYDVYNFYLAGADDKKWLKNNKITNDPAVFVVNANGDVLGSAKSDLTAQQYQFSYYGDLYRRLQRADAFVSIDKTFKNKKANDEDLIRAFNKAALLESSYDYDSEYTPDANSTEFIVTKASVDKKDVAQAWKKLIEAHQKDTKPNMYLAETILREIKNQGFTKQLFNQDKTLNDTDFLAIDYLLKHSDKIEEGRAEFNKAKGDNSYIVMGNVISEVSTALQQSVYTSQDGTSGDVNKEKINSIYKNIIASGKGNFEAYRNYFEYLSQVQDKDGSNTTYLREFKTYFESKLVSPSPIEKLDAMYSDLDPTSDYAYNGWSSFKDYHSNICNSAAWTVVEKPQNPSFIKDAIKWSEYSLVVTKNNPYYLDTLAQLYYKDGQKDKAIATQTLAVKYLDVNVEETTASEIKEVLNKMQNGTY